jgi:hypothetical protein
MINYNEIILNSLNECMRRMREYVEKGGVDEHGDPYSEVPDKSMSIVEGDFAEVITYAPGFQGLVERVCSQGGLEPEPAATVVTELIAKCLSLGTGPVEWVESGFLLGTKELGDEERKEHYCTVLPLIQSIAYYMISECTDHYRSALETVMDWQAQAGMYCAMPVQPYDEDKDPDIEFFKQLANSD